MNGSTPAPLREVVVSLASHPPRIEAAVESIRSVFGQTRPADRVILWLAKDEFPDGLASLPNEIVSWVAGDLLEIGWVERNLGPHNKYFWVMRQYSHSTIITVDDDIIYSSNMIEQLLDYHERYPEAVVAARTHLVVLDEAGAPLPYEAWIKEQSFIIGRPSLSLLATGCAGVLYPAGLLNGALLDPKEIEDRCLYADDIWLKSLELSREVPVVATPPLPLDWVEGSQEVGLWATINSKGGNDRAIAAVNYFRVDGNSNAALRSDWLSCAPAVARGFEDVSVRGKLSDKRASYLEAKNGQMSENLDRLLERLDYECQRKKELQARSQELLEEQERLALELQDLTDKYRALKKKSSSLRRKCSAMKKTIAHQESLLRDPYLVRLAKRLYRRLFKQ